MPVTTSTPVSRLVQDPKSIITEDVFRLDPALLGMPLARPWRRAAAMAVDGVIVAILANAPGVLFALAAALVLFRASARSTRTGYVRAWVRLTLRFWGAIALFAVVITTWDRLDDLGESLLDGDDPPASNAFGAVPSPPAPGTMLAGVGVAGDAILLATAENEEQARARGERLVASMRVSGMAASEMRDVLEGVQGTADKPWVRTVTDSLLQAGALGASDAELEPDSLVVALSGALAAGDAATVEKLRPQLALALAADTIRELDNDLRAARERAESLEEDLEEATGSVGFMAVMRGLAEDLGLGLGWTGLYFTACLALWNGYTPGKRLLRIRVIRLDGQPMGWWYAFERFGGYAASVATGLLGFAQILWNRNRQGIHDKISETVVIET